MVTASCAYWDERLDRAPDGLALRHFKLPCHCSHLEVRVEANTTLSFHHSENIQNL
jgi:hypothetical protein